MWSLVYIAFYGLIEVDQALCQALTLFYSALIEQVGGQDAMARLQTLSVILSQLLTDPSRHRTDEDRHKRSIMRLSIQRPLPFIRL